MKNLKDLFKRNYKFIIIVVSLCFIFLYPMPYYIDAPGGLTDLTDKVIIKNKKIEGSYNLAYVSEYKATIPTLIYAKLNKDYDVYKKKDVLLEHETDKEYNKRDRLFLRESLSNAVINAYKKASIEIEVTNNYLYVGYILDYADTNLKVGDEIESIDGINLKTKKEINKFLDSKNIGDKLSIQVKNNNKTYIRYAYVKEEKKKLIGIIPIEVFDYKTEPSVDILMDQNESGSSGGLLLALNIYDLLVDENISKGRKIAGTGTIDEEGNVGKIGGIKYKIKGAVKDKADVFFVPADNYKEAKEVIKENNYKLNLVKVNTLDEAIDYLKQ